MNPQTIIPLVSNVDELKEVIGAHFKGYVNVLLTLETVNYLLSLNVHNRVVKEASINAYEIDFEKTGYESIALMTIDDEGEFSDGQHRLLVLKRLFEKGWKSPPIWQLINLNVSKRRVESIDNGVVRSPVDVLVMHETVPTIAVARALKTYAMLCFPKLRKTPITLLEDIYKEGFYKLLELGEIRCIPQHGRHGYNTPSWILAGFRLLQQAVGTEKAKKAYDEFYNGNSLDLPMVRFRSLILSTRYAKSSERIRPWTKDLQCGLAKLFYAAMACINEKTITCLRGTRLGIKVYEREF